jgi:hypothetical protein
MTAQLSTTSYPEESVSDLAREVDEELRALVTMSRVSVTAQYAEPMYLSLDDEPFAILAARVRERDDSEAVVANGVRVSFVYDGDQRRARIDEIEGMTPGASFYVFDFLVVDNA